MNSVNITENMDSEKTAACNVKNIDIEDNHQNKMKIVDEKNVNSCVECIDISKIPTSNLENINIEENLVNKLESIDIEEILTSSIEVIDEENAASNLENINIKENLVNKIEKNEESLTSSEKLIHEENPESNVENSDSEDDWVDIELWDVQAKIARLLINISSFREDFDSSLHKFTQAKELFQTYCFKQDYLSSENGQLFMALMRKIDNSIYFIRIELGYWDDHEDFTPKQMLNVVTHPAFEYRESRFPLIYDELSKIRKYLRKIEELKFFLSNYSVIAPMRKRT